MSILILGLLLFFGVHSVRIFADGWRAARIARWGEGPWKLAYTAASVAGLVLVIWGYGLARAGGFDLWTAPLWMNHITGLLTWPAFVLAVAAYVPGTRIKAAVGHPLAAGTKLWAFAHLLSNARVADLLLFGSFVVWAALSFSAARRRDRAAGVTYPAKSVIRDLIAVIVGTGAWIAFGLWLHPRLIGVPVFG